MTANPILKMTDINKIYMLGDEPSHVLKDVTFEIQKGEFVAVLGPSGSGKSTLMNIIGCLDTPTSGAYYLHDKEVSKLNESQLATVRSKEIGFVFQSFQLLPRLNALRNVELPLIYGNVPVQKRQEIALSMLDRVGLSEKTTHFPNQLSGGQQQRVAIARALANNPTILLADEPTGALDQQTGKQVMALFHELNEEGHTIIMITHDIAIAKNAGRIVKLLDGRLSLGVAEDA